MQLEDPRPRPFSLWPVIRRYRLDRFKSDLVAALSVAFLALPQAIAYALLAGLPLISGLLAAIFGTIFTASFGASKYLIAGPSTSIAILIQTTIASTLAIYYPNALDAEKTALTFHILTHIVLIVGVIHIASSYFNVAKLLQFVSKPVILGYFVGVCLAIITSQLFTFWGIEKNYQESITLYRLVYFFSHLHQLDILQTIISSSSLFLFFVLKRYLPKLPYALIMIILISSICYLINSIYPDKAFFLGDVRGLFRLQFTFPFLDFKLLGIILPSACAISLLALLEVFSISRAISSKSGSYSPVNQEVFGSGISNLLLCFFHGAMPSSGSVSRSNMNYLVGARTRFSAIFSGFFVAILIALFSPVVSYISLGAISALLIASSFTMIEKRQIKLCLRATKVDALVFIVTFCSAVIFTLQVAFYIGIILSIITYLGRASIPHFVEYAFNRAGRLTVLTTKKSAKRHVRIIGIGGELFFGVVDLLQRVIQDISKNPYVKVIVLRLNGVYHADASLCLALLHLHEFLEKRGRVLVISGISPEVWKVIFQSHIVEKIGKQNFFLAEEAEPQLSTWKACLRAQEIIEK